MEWRNSKNRQFSTRRAWGRAVKINQTNVTFTHFHVVLCGLLVKTPTTA